MSGEAVFMALGEDRFMPTELARGPWSPDHQHGGAPTGLLTRAVERVETSQPMRIARVTFDFLGAIPIEEVEVTAEVLRPGRRVQWVGATLASKGKVLMRATALLIREEEGLSPVIGLDPAPQPLPGEDLVRASDAFGELGPMFAGGAVDILIAGGKDSWLESGPGRAWFCLKVPLVEGEDPSSQQRAVSAADFGNGISAPLDWGKWLFVNSDLSVNFSRKPAGGWMSLDSATQVSGDGTALTRSSLADVRGGIGIATQSLFVAPMDGASAFAG